MNDFYKILDITESATPEEIKKAFRKAAQSAHPDAGGSEEKMKDVNEAYDTLKDTNKKAHYDHTRKFGDQPQNPFGFRQTSGTEMDDIILRGHMHDMFMNMTYPGFQNTQPQNRDTRIILNITLEDALNGKIFELDLNINGDKKQVQLNIPKGIQNLQNLKFSGFGGSTVKNCPAGDLIASISILPHNRFIPNGVSLITFVEISSIEAMIGHSINIITLCNKTINVKIPVGTNYGTILKVPKFGLPVAHNSDMRGDLLVEVRIKTSKLDDDEMVIIKEMMTKRNNNWQTESLT